MTMQKYIHISPEENILCDYIYGIKLTEALIGQESVPLLNHNLGIKSQLLIEQTNVLPVIAFFFCHSLLNLISSRVRNAA